MNTRQKKVRKLIKDSKEFATNEFGIVENRLLTRVVRNSDNTDYRAVYASPPDEIKIVLGKYGQEIWPTKYWAKQREKELVSQGYETHLQHFMGFGNESCQITYPLLNASRVYVTYLVFHESFHIQSQKLKFRNSIELDETFAEAFGFYLQNKFFEDEPITVKSICSQEEQWDQYGVLMECYLKNMKKILNEHPRKKEETRREINRDAKKQSKNFQYKKIANILANSSFNNAFLLMTSFYIGNPLKLTRELRQINPHEYVHSKKDLENVLARLS